MSDILQKILEQKKAEVLALKKNGIKPYDLVFEHYDFIKSLLDDKGVSIIAEVKKASPSKGIICEDFDHLKIAGDYLKGGAKAISVLTDSKFFQGNLNYLCDIKSKTPLPVLRKDFIIDHVQVYESTLCGADAILLIVAALDKVLLSELLINAKEHGMDCLVEVHDEKELEIALEVKSELIGVNNRNLRDFSVDINTSFKIKKIVGDKIPIVSESGIKGVDDIKKLVQNKIKAALIGETLVRIKDNRADMLKEMVQAGRY
jgi:indole-3-glycerol phosphate synthase